MASVNITKPAAAQRQIDAAIQMLFSHIDILAVYTALLEIWRKNAVVRRGKTHMMRSCDRASRSAVKEILGESFQLMKCNTS